MYQTLDLRFLGYEEAIGCFLIETSAGPVLVESGPYSTFGSLRDELARFKYQPQEVTAVFLTHIHFDHAGAAWALAELGATIYVHPFGAGHLNDPSKLVNSATMIYGDQMEVLWGDMRAIPAEKIHACQHNEAIQIGDKTFTALHTPGHAKHHIAWQLEKTLFTGDVAGVKIGGGPVVPPCPPPDINIADWNESIDLILSRDIQELVLTHFDAVTDIVTHMDALRHMLNDWAMWVRNRWENGDSAEEITPKFVEYTNDQLRAYGVSNLGLEQYAAANPAWMSVAGLIRYWKKSLAE